MQPKNYLDYVTSYLTNLGASRKALSDARSRLSGGLTKLEQAGVEVAAMQVELSQAQLVVQAATKECDELLQVGACRASS